MAAFQVKHHAAGVGLNVSVCLGGPEQNVHSDACLAPLQSANYLFILDSTQSPFMGVKWPFYCSRQR